MEPERDVALVLSGGGMNGVLMELGFLLRLRLSPLWPRVGWIFGTSAGALSGSMAALDRLDDLERLLLSLDPNDLFRPHRLWQLPLLGLHDYTLPRTVAERLGDPLEIARRPGRLAGRARRADDRPSDENDGADGYEVAYSSRTTPPEELSPALFASSAVSALVLPLRIGGRIATDGSWVRNFPLGYAYDHPEVRLIVAFRYVAQYPRLTAEWLAVLRRRLERFRRVAPVRAFVSELREAEERSERGEPAHLADMIARLARVAVVRNTNMEERAADDKDRSILELGALRDDVVALAAEHDSSLAAAVETRFAAARFPFRHDRVVPRLTVRGTSEGISLTPGFRVHKPWSEDDKRRLIARGYEQTDDLLAENATESVSSGASS